MKNTANRHQISYRQFGTQGQERAECPCGFKTSIQQSHDLAVEVANAAHLNSTVKCGYCGAGHKTNPLCLTAR